MTEEICTRSSGIARRIRSVEGWLLPATISALLHGMAVVMLWGGGWQAPQANAPAARVQTQLMTLTYEAAPPEPQPLPVPPPPIVEPPPTVAEPVVDQGLIARQRLEQEEREREEKQREEQEIAQREEQQRQQEQELARQQDQERQEQQRAEEAQRARDEQQRMAAAAQAQAAADAEAAAMAQYQPIQKAPPAYPRRALDSKIEGDCTVVYTVTPEGRVRKPQVVEGACDDPMFMRPSLQAASAFRYQPRIVNGRAVAVHDVHNTFRYRIQ